MGGGIVWVQRNNGTWWPGKILCNTDDTSISRFPIKLLGRDNGSVSWYNLEKSNRVKAFRCGEFDDCIKRAESSKVSFSYSKFRKYTHREDAILHALQLEKQEQEKLKKPVLVSGCKESEMQGESVQKAKRSRRVYSPVDSISFLEKSVDSQSSKMIPTSNHAAENSSSKSTSSLKNDSKSSHRKKGTTAGPDALGPRKTSFKVTKCKPRGKLHNQHYRSRSVVSTNERSTDRSHKGDSVLASRQEVLGFETNTLGRNVNKMSRPSRGYSFSEDTSSQSLISEFATRKNIIKTLIDVHMTVEGTYRGEHTPLVSLMSGLNGKAIIGHPINVEVLDDNSEILVEKERSDEEKRSRIPPLVWRKSKRTPVCYTTKNGKFQQGSKNMWNKSTIKTSVTCVPVKDIFIKLIEALKEA